MQDLWVELALWEELVQGLWVELALWEELVQDCGWSLLRGRSLCKD